MDQARRYRRGPTMFVGVTAILVLLLAGCLPAADQTRDGDRDHDSEGPVVGDRPVGGSALAVGRTFRYDTVEHTVQGSRDPFPFHHLKNRPPAGHRWIGLRLKTCKQLHPSHPPGKSLARATGASSLDWVIADDRGVTYGGFPDVRRSPIRPDFASQYQRFESGGFPPPRYPLAGVVFPGECVSGWLVIAVPEDVQPSSAVLWFHPRHHSDGGQTLPLAEWSLTGLTRRRCCPTPSILP